MEGFVKFFSGGLMSLKTLMVWFGVFSCLLVLAGTIFSFFGFSFFPPAILPKNVLLPWESAIFGSVLIGWGVTLFFLGRLAFRRNDGELMKILLLGIVVWLVIDSAFSIYLGVFSNVVLNFAILVFSGFPLIKSIRKIEGKAKK